MKEIADIVKKKKSEQGKGFSGCGSWEIQELIATTPEELTDDLMEMSTSKPVPDSEQEDIEETMAENKLTLDNLAEAF